MKPKGIPFHEMDRCAVDSTDTENININNNNIFMFIKICPQMKYQWSL